VTSEDRNVAQPRVGLFAEIRAVATHVLGSHLTPGFKQTG